MEFVDNLSKEEYIKFCEENNAHFLQTYAWGEVNKKTRDLIPCYVGLKKDNELVAVSLLLKKETPLGRCYYYAPRGFVMDMHNELNVKVFTDKLKDYLRENNAIYLRINPAIKYQDIDDDANPIKNDNNNYHLLEYLTSLGYLHQGFYKLHKGNEPRYTFRIDLTKDKEEIESKMNKGFLKAVKRSYDYDLEIKESNDIDTFYNLIKENASKDGFKSYPLTFYKTLFDEFKEYKQIKIFEAVLNPSKVLKKFNDELKELNAKLDTAKNKVDIENIIKRITNDIELLSEYESRDNIVVCSLVCVYSCNGAWTLYIGNNNLGTKTSAVNRLYYESFMDAKKNNYDFMDLFGTVGDPHTKFKNMAGIHEFKRKMGGEYIEFIGEFDLVNKSFMYKILPKLLKIYRKLRG